MGEPLDELYFVWLYEKVADPDFHNKELTYWKVLKILFTKEFVWLVANDENRIEDGKALRIEFIENQGFSDVDPDWMDLPCSMLEVMVGLSRRLEFAESSGRAYYWFWVLMENIGLIGFNDTRRFTSRQMERIDDILNDVIYRRYDKSGHGGFFPQRDPYRDQRKLELWGQMGDYILEQAPDW